MKRFFLFLSILCAFSFSLNAQGLKGMIKNATKKDSSGKSSVNKMLGMSSGKSALSNDEIISGLKEALEVGTERSATKLSAVDGFFKDAVIKILMPAEAQKAEKTLRNMGLGKQVDNAILSMNRAAEDAAKSAAPIFINTIKGMSFQDALGILRGGDNAATNYLKDKTTFSLTEAFRPVIENSLKKVDATKYWNTVFTTYNKVSMEKVNPDLAAMLRRKHFMEYFTRWHRKNKRSGKILWREPAIF